MHSHVIIPAAVELASEGFFFFFSLLPKLREWKETSRSWIPLTSGDNKAAVLPSLHLGMFHQIQDVENKALGVSQAVVFLRGDKWEMTRAPRCD